MTCVLDYQLGQRRADIVAALNGLVADVGGQPVAITASPGQPTTVDRYQAWPVWVNGVPYTAAMAETFWLVYVTLPAADELSTIDAANGLISAVGDALMGLGAVTATRPVRVVATGNSEGVPAIQYEITI